MFAADECREDMAADTAVEIIVPDFVEEVVINRMSKEFGYIYYDEVVPPMCPVKEYHPPNITIKRTSETPLCHICGQGSKVTPKVGEEDADELECDML